MGPRRRYFSGSASQLEKKIEAGEFQDPPGTTKDLLTFLKHLSEHLDTTGTTTNVNLSNTWLSTDPNYSPDDGGGRTLVHHAAQQGHLRTIELVCNTTGYRIDTPVDTTDTELILGLKSKRADVAEVLLRHGANPDQYNGLPLMVATFNLDHDSLKVLYDSGASCMLRPETNSPTELHLACQSIQRELTRIQGTVESDSDDKAIGLEKDRLIQRALPVLKLILERIKNVQGAIEGVRDTRAHNCILNSFAQFDFDEGISILLKEPFQLDPNDCQVSPLWIASWHSCLDSCEVLLRSGSNPNVLHKMDPRERFQRTSPLLNILERYHEKRRVKILRVVRLLLEKGVEVCMGNDGNEYLIPHALKRCQDKELEDLVLPVLVSQVSSGSNPRQQAQDMFLTIVLRFDASLIADFVKMGASYNSKRSFFELGNPDTHGYLGVGTPLMNILGGNDSKQATAYFDSIKSLDNHEYHLFDWDTGCKIAHLQAAAKEGSAHVLREVYNLIEPSEDLHEIIRFTSPAHKELTFRKTALEWAVENNDRYCIYEILEQEYNCHKDDKEGGLRCLQEQISSNEVLTWTIETFCRKYPKEAAERHFIPFLRSLITLLSLIFLIMDYVTDLMLAFDYFHKTGFYHPVINSNDAIASPNHTVQCPDQSYTTGDYQTAFVATVTGLLLPFLVIIPLAIKETCNVKLKFLSKQWQVIGFKAILITICLLPLPLSIILLVLCLCYHRFQHFRFRHKHKVRRPLELLEYYWGVAKTLDTGTESCLQLVLQLWLVTFRYRMLHEARYLARFDMAVHGVLHFLGGYQASELERSMAKILISFASLLLAFPSCHRVLKRGALRVQNQVFLYISFFMQVNARIVSFLAFFLAVRHFFPSILVFLLIHFFFVFLIKHLNEPRVKSCSLENVLAGVTNVAASSLVYVRILPLEDAKAMMVGLEGQEVEVDSPDYWEDEEEEARGFIGNGDTPNGSPRDRHNTIQTAESTRNSTIQLLPTNGGPKDSTIQIATSNGGPGGAVYRNGHLQVMLPERPSPPPKKPATKARQDHATFKAQSLFFLLAFVENLALITFAWLYGSPRPNQCLGSVGFEYLWLMLFCILSWVSHGVYYKVIGHPWAEINGPALVTNWMKRLF